ncbi:hypothetical protein [Chitinibacter sp. S2-10]|uniref:hypothetical protein n=1 Tax=Chitinibacter sp. S2-10 TaxID=3373597 RepID=UPI0039779F2D
MSDEVIEALDADPPPRAVPPVEPGFFQRYRLPFIWAGSLFLLIFFLLLGIAVGMSKRSFEKKFYVEQIVKLKTTILQQIEAHDAQDEELKQLRIDLRAKSDRVDELEKKLAELGGHSRTSSASRSSTTQELSSATGDPGVDYLHLKTGDCVVDGQAAATAQQWKACLQNAKKTPGAKN